MAAMHGGTGVAVLQHERSAAPLPLTCLWVCDEYDCFVVFCFHLFHWLHFLMVVINNLLLGKLLLVPDAA